MDKFLKRTSPTKRPCPSPNGSNEDLTSLPEKDVPKVSNRRNIKLQSLIDLRRRVSEEGHPALRDLIANHSFVGCINRKLALLQHQTKLYVTNTTNLSEHLFYQIFLNDFGDLNSIRLSEPAPIYDLAMLALDQPEAGWNECDGEKSELACYAVKLLKGNAEMIEDYFSMEIDKDGNLVTIPLLYEGYVPYMGGLPMYILRLATEVNWSDEGSCFDNFARETAKFYRISPYESSQYDFSQHTMETEDLDVNSWRQTVEQVIYPAAKQILNPPKICSEDMTFVQVANLPDLYKVFERC